MSRKTGTYSSTVAGQQAGAAGNQIAAWYYDNSNNVTGVTHAVGHLTTEIAYTGGAPYTTQYTNFNVFGEPLGTSTTIPTGEGLLADTYTVKHTYTSTLGLPSKDIYSAQGGLPAETVGHTYDPDTDLPDGIGGLTGFAETTAYDDLSRPSQATIGAAPNIALVTNQYDPNSGRLTDQLITRKIGSNAAENIDEQAYKYDPAGNLITQTGTRLSNTATAETQCYRYDGLDQLVAAWTAGDTCTTTPSATNSSMVADPLGAGSAYWTTWSIDTQGDRTQQTRHAFTGGPSTDTTTTYTYGNAAGQPHTLTSTTTNGATSGSTAYRYDAAGNTTTRNAGQGNQTLAYNDADQLTSVSGSSTGSSTFVYDADGNVLLQKDPGTTVLYLGDQQFTLNTATSTVTGTRYYALPGGGQAMRTGTAATAIVFALPDQHGTPTLYLDYTFQTPTWRQYTPYGASRGATITAPDNRGFLNKPDDKATGLTLVGARQYDSTVGRFITADPVLETADPTQISGYAYAGNNPVVHADPTGLFAIDPDLDTQFGEAKKGTGKKVNPVARVAPGDGQTSGGTAPATKTKKRSAFSRFLTTLGNDAAGMAQSTVHNLVPGSCLIDGIHACIDQAEQGLHLFGLAMDGTDCLLTIECDNINKDFNCQNGSTAECNANLTFFVATILLTKGVGEVAVADEAADAEAVNNSTKPPEPTGCSFAGTTPVLMADGNTKPIDDIKIGDSVSATDPANGKVVSKTVTALHDDLDTDMADVTIADSHGKRTVLHTTQNHPFWDTTTNTWTRADHLNPGDHLESTTPATVYVVTVHSFTQPNHRFNLTVTDLHTYYVLAGTTPVLVHNTCPRVPWIAPDSLPAAENAALDDTLAHIDAGNVPTGATARRWGIPFRNRGGDLPGGQGDLSPYREYRVAPPPGVNGAGPLRVVRNEDTGETYYTWTHYGDSGDPAFVRIR